MGIYNQANQGNEEEKIQDLIKKVSKHIPGIQQPQDANTSQQLMELTQKLFERNKQLENEKLNIKEEIRKKVQNSGHLVLQKFQSFGGNSEAHSKNSLEIAKADLDFTNLQKQVQDLTKKLEMKELSQSLN